MPTRTLPTHDLKLIDDRRLVYQGEIASGPFQGAGFQAEDGMGVIVSIEQASSGREVYHISVTRPDQPPTDDDLAVVRIAVCGPGTSARIVTPEDSMLSGRIVHLIEDPEGYEPPDVPWWTAEEFNAWAAALQQTPEARDRYLDTLQHLGLVRLNRRDDPERGPLVQVDLRALLWRDERRRQQGGPDC